MSGEYSERAVREKFEDHGWVTGGSPGGADVDLVAVHPERGGVIVEVKSTKASHRFTFSQHQHTRDQADHLRDLSHDGYPVIYVIHFKSGSRAGRIRVYPAEALDYTSVRRPRGVVLGEWLEGGFPEFGGW